MSKSKLSISDVFYYLLIYSVFGYIIETLYFIIRYGRFECHQSLLFGPFCLIYGIGAVVIIVTSTFYDKNVFTLFLGGALTGSVTEYVGSLVIEAVFKTTWWDYTGKFLNINGRVCLLQTVMWGLLTILLIRVLNPYVDKFLTFIKSCLTKKVYNIITSIIFGFIIIDILITIFALVSFTVRVIKDNNIEVSYMDTVDTVYDYIYNNEYLSNIVYKYFDDTTMVRLYPLQKITDKYGNVIKVRHLYRDIKFYYYKFSWFRD